MIIGKKLHYWRRQTIMTKKIKLINFIKIVILVFVIVTLFFSIKSYLQFRERQERNKKLMLSWFGYGDMSDSSTIDSNSNSINPIYTETMERWEEKGLLSIMEETEVWTCATCDFIRNYEFDQGTMEYDILYGGISFEEIDYVEFTRAMLNIGSVVASRTTDPRDMHDYWEEAALLESTNAYD